MLGTIMTKRALVLGGGGAYGAWQAGVLAGLTAYGRRWDAIYGASIGAVNGSYLAGASVEQQEDQAALLAHLWTQIDNQDIYRVSWRTIVDLILSPMPLSSRPSLSEGDRLHRFIHQHVQSKPKVPFAFTVTDLEAGESVIIRAENSEDMRPWVVASCSIPVLFPPVTIRNRRYVDGGTVDNDPVGVALGDGFTELDVVLCSASPKRLPETRQISLMDAAYLAVRDLLGAHSVQSVQAAIAGKAVSVNLYAPAEDLGGSILSFNSKDTTEWCKQGIAFGVKRIAEQGNDRWVS